MDESKIESKIPHQENGKLNGRENIKKEKKYFLTEKDVNVLPKNLKDKIAEILKKRFFKSLTNSTISYIDAANFINEIGKEEIINATEEINKNNPEFNKGFLGTQGLCLIYAQKIAKEREKE